MIVQELISQLLKLPRDIEVVMSKDGEGNGFSPLAEAIEGLYHPDSTYSGDVYDLDDEEAPNDCNPVVVLYPTN